MNTVCHYGSPLLTLEEAPEKDSGNTYLFPILLPPPPLPLLEHALPRTSLSSPPEDGKDLLNLK